MNTKITRKRLGDFLSYEWIKIIALWAVCILVWSLIFTVSAVRLTVGQEFKIFLYHDVYAGDNFGDFGSSLKKDGTLSFDVLNYNSETLLPATYAQVLQARFSVNEGDIMILTHTQDTESESDSSLYSFVDSYGYASYPIDKLLSDAKEYYLKYYTQDGNINYSYLKQAFNARMKKDNRFKSQAQYENGYRLEAMRIETLKENWQILNDYITENSQDLIKYKMFSQLLSKNPDLQGYEIEKEERAYGLDISKTQNITNLFKNTAGKAEGLTLVVLDRLQKQPDLQFEVIPVIVKMLQLK